MDGVSLFLKNLYYMPYYDERPRALVVRASPDRRTFPHPSLSISRCRIYRNSSSSDSQSRISGDTVNLKFKKGDKLSIDIDRLYRNTTVPRGIRGVSEEIAEEYPTSDEEEMLLDY